MTNARKARAKRREAAVEQSPRSPWVERGLLAFAAVAVIVIALSIWRLGGAGTVDAGAGPVHVHGLGVNPADGALFIATHTGLFRVGRGAQKAARVSDSHQDTMGFTIVGEDRFLGSGHPDLRTDWPPLLGLIESTDAGRGWESVSLLGEVDFHVLRYSQGRVYGYDVTGDRLLVSDDAGRTWDEVQRPAPLLDLAVDPADRRHVLATGGSDLGYGIYESLDGGESWERLGSSLGLLAWPNTDRLYLVEESGGVSVSVDGGGAFDARGTIGGRPAALLGTSSDELYVALHDGTIEQSLDGGQTWTVHSTP